MPPSVNLWQDQVEASAKKEPVIDTAISLFPQIRAPGLFRKTMYPAKDYISQPPILLSVAM